MFSRFSPDSRWNAEWVAQRGRRNKLVAEAGRRFAVRIRITVRPEGFGSQLDQMSARLDANCGVGSWSMALSGTCGVVNDSLAIYFLAPALARASLLAGV